MQTNAPAAWISALVAASSCILLLRSRKTPKKLVFREVSNTSVVSIWPAVRDKIKMTFDDKPISSLGQIEARVFNSGSEVIHEPSFVVSLPKKSEVLSVSTSPEHFNAQWIVRDNTVTVSLPYLNPVRDHSQIVKLSLLTEGRTKIVGITGGGEGWSVKHLALPNPKRQTYFAWALIVYSFLSVVASFFYSRHIELVTGIPSLEISWRAFVAYLPPFVFLIPLGCVVAFRIFRNLRKG